MAFLYILIRAYNYYYVKKLEIYLIVFRENDSFFFLLYYIVLFIFVEIFKSTLLFFNQFLILGDRNTRSKKMRKTKVL
jgi:Na+/melibiose symporter-like transporter